MKAPTYKLVALDHETGERLRMESVSPGSLVAAAIGNKAWSVSIFGPNGNRFVWRPDCIAKKNAIKATLLPLEMATA